ncbi:tyrosine-type recombinase/integrase [Domibacillus enclensis]
MTKGQISFYAELVFFKPTPCSALRKSHLFRHTASKLFLERGGSMRVLQKILGHRDIQTTMIYSHVFDLTIKNQHEQFSPIKHLDEKQGYKTRTNKKGRLKRQ